jgi:hypothetical protein
MSPARRSGQSSPCHNRPARCRHAKCACRVSLRHPPGHPGLPGGRLLDFLREHPAEQTYLIGDIIDFWAMSRSINWSRSQNTVVQKLLRRARHGDRWSSFPGNHDEVLRDYCGIVFGDIEVVAELVHETADGRPLSCSSTAISSTR